MVDIKWRPKYLRRRSRFFCAFLDSYIQRHSFVPQSVSYPHGSLRSWWEKLLAFHPPLLNDHDYGTNWFPFSAFSICWTVIVSLTMHSPCYRTIASVHFLNPPFSGPIVQRGNHLSDDRDGKPTVLIFPFFEHEERDNQRVYKLYRNERISFRFATTTKHKFLVCFQGWESRLMLESSLRDRPVKDTSERTTSRLWKSEHRVKYGGSATKACVRHAPSRASKMFCCWTSTVLHRCCLRAIDFL